MNKKQTYKEMKFVPYSAEMFTLNGFVHYTEDKVYKVAKIKKKGAWGFELI